MASQQSQTEEGDCAAVLRVAVRSLHQHLAHFGLVPSRALYYLREVRRRSAGDGARQRQPQFPPRQTRVTICKLEQQEDMQSAVLSFMETLLADDAPPDTLTDFMEGLFEANSDLEHLNVNEGAWRVHDVIKLTCTYMPLQQALLDYLNQPQGQSPGQKQRQDQGQDQIQSGDGSQGHDVEVQGVVAQMDRRRLLKPEFTPRVLETCELHGTEAALVHLLASLYATRVDMLREEFADRLEEGGGPGQAAGNGDIPGGNSVFWLRCFIEAIEEHGGKGFKQIVPESVLSADTWAAVYEELAYGHRGRTLDNEDVNSEAGESVATLLPEDDGEGDNVHTVPLKQSLAARQELARNIDQIARHDRTAEYVHGITKDYDQMNIPRTTDIYRYDFKHSSRFPDPEPATMHCAAGSDRDDSGSVFSECSGSFSTDNNSCDWNQNSAQFLALRAQAVSRYTSGDGQVQLRRYQEELLYWARQGKNVAIFLPTGTGKTFIIIKFVQEQLQKPGLHRVMFLAPKVKLAEQQYNRFRDFFPNVTYFRCGRSRSSHAPFSELLDTYKVFVMTPQCLVEAVEAKEVKITDFSLMVLDECHHVALGKHAYRVLMGLYLDARCAPGTNLISMPQVIGLTASPGVGQSGTLTGAVVHIKTLCYSMDVERICIVKDNKEELQYYINEPAHEIHSCKRRKTDGFKKILEEIMQLIEQSMIQSTGNELGWSEEHKQQLRRILMAPDLHRGRPQYHHWVSTLNDKLVDFSQYQDTYKRLFSLTEMLVVCQRCLTLNEDCHSQYAFDYLEEQVKVLDDQVPRGRYSSIERKLLDQFFIRRKEMQRACNDPEDYNPKLKMLEDILLGIMERDQVDCACMVFVRTLELTKAIQNWVQNHPELKSLTPGRITGSKRAVYEGGMTRQEISDVMTKFNLGIHKLVVCTSAAEEGLDFQACNVVVRYDYVTSMISMIQTRGRARRMDSKYCLVGTMTQGNTDKENANLAYERLMNQAMDEVLSEMDRNPNAFMSAMETWQHCDVQVRKSQRESKVQKNRAMETSSVVYRLLCRKCQNFACLSSDFRLVGQSSRAVLAEDFRNRWQRKERGEVYQFQQSLEKVAKVHCGRADCAYDWGVLVRYIPTDRLLPLLKIESFFLQDCRDGQKLSKKFKWSNAPFHVAEATEEELV